MIDLHTHSTMSDGSMSPEELVLYASELGLKVMALTDHDTTDGLGLASKTAKKTGIIFVPGTELTISWHCGEFHLLGLGLNIGKISNRLNDLTASLKKDRLNRNLQIIEKMKNDGFDVNYEEIETLAGTECVGRPHFAKYFVSKGIVKNRQQAFDRYIARGRPYYVEKSGCSLDEAIVAIKESEGLPILAHPLSLYIAWGKMENTLLELKERGIVGIEAWHPGAREADCRRLEFLGKKMQFIVTAGSDFHGKEVRKDRFLGYTAGKIEIADRFYYENLSPFLGNGEM